MTFSRFLKERLAKCLSMVTRKPVITGQSFTTSDDSNNQPRLPVRKPGLVKYCSVSGKEFVLVGQYLVQGENVTRLMDDETGEIFGLDTKLFNRLFKLI